MVKRIPSRVYNILPESRGRGQNMLGQRTGTSYSGDWSRNNYLIRLLCTICTKPHSLMAIYSSFFNEPNHSVFDSPASTYCAVLNRGFLLNHYLNLIQRWRLRGPCVLRLLANNATQQIGHTVAIHATLVILSTCSNCLPSPLVPPTILERLLRGRSDRCIVFLDPLSNLVWLVLLDHETASRPSDTWKYSFRCHLRNGPLAMNGDWYQVSGRVRHPSSIWYNLLHMPSMSEYILPMLLLEGN